MLSHDIQNRKAFDQWPRGSVDEDIFKGPSQTLPPMEPVIIENLIGNIKRLPRAEQPHEVGLAK